jgi:flagellar protein FliS
VLELRSSLRPELWTGGSELTKIYSYLHAMLLAANVTKDGAKVRDAIRLVEPLHAAWHEAAAQAAGSELAKAGALR